MKFIGKILPVDGYYVIMNDNLSVNYAKSLTHLYQPLVGMNAVSLYNNLLHEIDLQKESSLQTHHTLMNYLNLSLDDIYRARLKLEGIGLLRTYERSSSENKSFLYKLQSPFSPNNFFKDDMLSELLYYHLGKDKYQSVKSHYTEQFIEQLGNDITASFSEVFQTFKPDFEKIDKPIINNQQQSGPNIKIADLASIEIMLKQRMIPTNKVLTTANRKLITEMMFLYDLAEYEIEKSVLWALTEENLLDTAEFKVACHDLFKVKHNQLSVTLTPKPQPKPKDEKAIQSLTKEEQLIHQFETISPKHLLEDLSSGNQASEREMRMIREIMTNQGLPAPVMNVLVHYVLIQSDMKLSKAYLETIATHWSRANLKTAKEAMAFAKKQIKEYQEGKAKKQNYRQQASNEVIPEWFKDRNKKQVNKTNNSTTNNNLESEKEREELAALIQQFAGNEQK